MADKPKDTAPEKDPAAKVAEAAKEVEKKAADAAAKMAEAAKLNAAAPVKEALERRTAFIKLRTQTNMHGDRTGIGSVLQFISGKTTHQNSSKAPPMPELHPHKKHEEHKPDAHAKKPAKKDDHGHGDDHGHH